MKVIIFNVQIIIFNVKIIISVRVVIHLSPVRIVPVTEQIPACLALSDHLSENRSCQHSSNIYLLTDRSSFPTFFERSNIWIFFECSNIYLQTDRSNILPTFLEHSSSTLRVFEQSSNLYECTVLPRLKNRFQCYVPHNLEKLI